MNKVSSIAPFGLLAAVLAGCVPAEPGASVSSGRDTAPAGTVDVRAEMQQHVNPAMLSIWDVTNNAMDDSGALDAGRINEAQWLQLAAAAGELAASGVRMSAEGPLIAASAGNAEAGEGEVSMADVQRYLDSDPRLFRQMASAFATHSGKVAAAARNRDAATTGDLVTRMDAVCESCHARFWYPEQ